MKKLFAISTFVLCSLAGANTITVTCSNQANLNFNGNYNFTVNAAGYYVVSYYDPNNLNALTTYMFPIQQCTVAQVEDMAANARK